MTGYGCNELSIQSKDLPNETMKKDAVHSQYRICKKCYRVQGPDGVWHSFLDLPKRKVKKAAFGLCLMCCEQMYVDQEEIRILMQEGYEEHLFRNDNPPLPILPV